MQKLGIWRAVEWITAFPSVCAACFSFPHFAAILVTLALFFPSTPVAAQETSPTGQEINPYRAYSDGDVTRSIAILNKSLSEQSSPAARIGLHLHLIYICASVDDYDCFIENSEKASEQWGILKNDADQRFNTEHYRKQLTAWLVYQFWWQGKYEEILNTPIATHLNKIPTYEFDPISYLKLQSALSKIYFLNFNHSDSRKSITRMTNYLATRESLGTELSEYQISLFISEIIRSFYLLKDSFNSFKFFIYFDSFLLDHLPPASVENIQYLALSAEILASVQGVPAAREAIKRLDYAHNMLESANIEQEIKKAKLSYLKTLQTAIALSIGQVADAERYHLQNPFSSSRDQIIERGSFERLEEFYFAITDLYLAIYSEKNLDTRWESLIAQPLTWWEDDDSDKELFKSLRLFGLGVTSSGSDREEARGYLTQSAESRIRIFEQRLSGQSSLFPLPDFVDRIILSTALTAYSQYTRPLNERERNVALAGAEILQRNPRHAFGDYLRFASNLETDTSRRVAQSYQQISTRLSDLEFELLKHLTAPNGDTQKDPESEKQIYLNFSRSLIDLSNESDAIRSSLSASGVNENFLHAFPTIDDIGGALSDGEALVFYALSVGTVHSVCIRSDRFDLKSKPIEQSIAFDIKLLRRALTGTHPVSEKLDSRYPVNAALRLKEFLFGGLEECLSGISKLSYIPLADTAAIPVETLLEAPPPRIADGFDLKRASWMLDRFDVAYSGSVQEFLASRKLSDHAGGNLPFLGIGDPALAELTDSGIKRGQLIALRGASTVNGPLTDLSELPETGDELRAIASQIDGAVVHTREDATEALIRAEPLGNYNLINLATHGLIQGEVAGIVEPGLVLTPPLRQIGNSQDDGFWSASEIASARLNARIVVLSACNSANFDMTVFASGLRSLASAFSISGVPTIVASLWPVETHASKAIVTGFFEELMGDDGTDAATALAQAKRQFIDQSERAFAHPRFWAPFIVAGNGSTIARQSDDNEKIALTSFKKINDPGGEVLSSATTGSGDVYLSRMGDWNGKRMASFVEKRMGSGDVIWQRKSREIGAGVMISAGDRLYAAGFVSRLNGQVSQPVIRAFDTDGRELWRWEAMLNPGETASVLDMQATETGELFFLEQRVVSQNSRTSSLFRLHHLEKNGSLRETRSIGAFPGIQGNTNGKILKRENDTIVVLEENPDFKIDNKNNDEFGNVRVCITQGSILLRLHDDINHFIDPKHLPSMHINRLTESEGITLIVGYRRSPCQMDGHAYLGKINEEGSASPIYVEERLYPTEFTDIDVAEQSAVLSGTWIRRFSERTSKDLPDVKGYEPLDPILLDENKMREAFFVMLSNDKFVRRDFIGAGASAIVRSVSRNGRRVSFSGLVGAYPLFGSFDYPSNIATNVQ